MFTSLADDLVADDNNGSQDVFLRDLQTGVTKRLNLLPDGSQITGAGNANNGDMQIDISADGRFVSFVYAHDLVGNGPPVTPVPHLRDTQTDQTRLVGSNPSYGISYSALASDGATLAYASVSSQSTAIVLHDISANSTGIALHLQYGQRHGLPRGRAQHLRQWPIRGVHRAFPALLSGSTVAQVVGIDRSFPSSIIIASTGANGTGDGASSYFRNCLMTVMCCSPPTLRTSPGT